MEIKFGVGLRDKDGDCYKEDILLFIESRTILRVNNLNELKSMAEQISLIHQEVRENYPYLPTEPQKKEATE